MTHPVSLKSHNSFGLEHSCRELVTVITTEQLISCCLALYQAKEPMLVLGSGSNVILCDDFEGTVVLVETKGIEITGNKNYHYLSVAAGENWHELICFCLEHDIAGLENLALIPGKVGAAPIQNIGAYGVELMDVCDWVEYVDLSNGEYIRLDAKDCKFTYRDSIFKKQLLGKALITRVGFKVAKVWKPKLDYGPLKALKNSNITPREVFNCICETRMTKLPDPKVVGNAGSFFKNPVITKHQFNTLARQFPNIVGYPHGTANIKVAAGWLIEAAGLKGYQVGGAAVHDAQALVLINRNNATSRDILALAQHVVDCIEVKFGITLEPEPRMITSTGEGSL